MNKIVSYILIMMILVTTSPINQLLKLPNLYKHYSEHQNLNKNLDFVGYLKMHYAHSDHTKSDNHSKENLPFKTAGSQLNSSGYTMPHHDVLDVVSIFDHKVIELSQNFAAQQFTIEDVLIKTFQPPDTSILG